MQSKSAAQRKLERDNAKWRKALIETIGRCQLNDCAGAWPNTLCVHEIPRGTGRSKAYSRRLACMVVCAFCNAHRLTDYSIWPMERQTALQITLCADFATPQEIINEINFCRGDQKMNWPDVAAHLTVRT